ncbi:MAG: hypothetical protein E6J72_00815 [Deltaproteobacteria bacterium]|nr:MAG: hypothetical protein E6J72_00815 [Deltaproteobacteria bacterium]
MVLRRSAELASEERTEAVRRTLRQRRSLSREPIRSAAWLLALVVVKAAVLASLYHRGFLSISADEFARGVRAMHWAAHPTLAWSDFSEAWLPPEKILNGTALMVWPDPIWAPRATAFLASCVLLVAFHRMVRLLFEPWLVAALASALLVVQPWYIWLSGTPALDVYYLSLFVLGLGFLVEWLRDDVRGRWLAAALCFLLASGFHVQSWLLINLVHVLTLGFLVRAVRQRDARRGLRLIGTYVISDAFMLACGVGALVVGGVPLAFLGEHTRYSKWFYGGYDVSVADKLLFYPTLLARYLPWTARLLLVVGIVLSVRERGARWKLAPVVLGITSLAAYSLFNLASVPPTAAPERYTLLWTLLALPSIAYAVVRIGAGFGSRSIVVRTVALAVAFACVAMLVAHDVAIARRIPAGIGWGPVLAGRTLDTLMDVPGADPSGRFMIELRYWDFLGVELAARHPGRSCYDRERNRQLRDLPSLFVENAETIRARLADLHVEWVALTSPELTSRADALPWLARVGEVGGWRLYRVRASTPAASDGGT